MSSRHEAIDRRVLSCAVLVPVKDFTQAKGRLSGALGAAERARLARAMATHVVNAQTRLDVAVACDDEEVAAWARGLGARVVWCPGTDLNGAVTAGRDELRSAGYDQVIVAHSDLPRAGDLAELAGWPGVTIAPDEERRGTNVLCVPTGLDFVFTYGIDSCPSHVREAVRHRCGLRIVHDARLALDIDHPDDLQGAAADALDALQHPPAASPDPSS